MRRDSDISAARALIEIAAHNFAALGIESARLDSEILMAEAAGVTREAVITGSIELSNAILNQFNAMVARREKREPVAYIVGHKEFYSLDFDVGSAVLIPRPETEFVVAAALEYIKTKPDARVLDIGTGSGAIAIAIKVNAPDARVTTTEVSLYACAFAIRNFLRHGVRWAHIGPTRRLFRYSGQGRAPSIFRFNSLQSSCIWGTRRLRRWNPRFATTSRSSL